MGHACLPYVPREAIKQSIDNYGEYTRDSACKGIWTRRRCALQNSAA